MAREVHTDQVVQPIRDAKGKKGVPPAPVSDLMEIAAGASAKQRAVVESIQALGGTAKVADIARYLDSHPNTVRGHLDELTELGLIGAEPEPSQGRGRPSLVYFVRAPRESDVTSAYVDLAETLAGVLAQSGADDPSDLGRRWATSRSSAKCVGINGLLDELRALGFDPYVRASGALGLRSCPFVRAGGKPPVPFICRLHAGYLSEVGVLNDLELVPFDLQGECGVKFGSQRAFTEQPDDPAAIAIGAVKE